MRQLLSKAAVLAFGGTLLSLLISSWGINLLRLYTPADALPRGEQIALDPAGVIFTAIVGVVTVFVASLRSPPAAFHVPNQAVGMASRTIGLSGCKSRTRSTLVVIQVALSLVLVVGAGLLLKSF